MFYHLVAFPRKEGVLLDPRELVFADYGLNVAALVVCAASADVHAGTAGWGLRKGDHTRVLRDGRTEARKVRRLLWLIRVTDMACLRTPAACSDPESLSEQNRRWDLPCRTPDQRRVFSVGLVPTFTADLWDCGDRFAP